MQWRCSGDAVAMQWRCYDDAVAPLRFLDASAVRLRAQLSCHRTTRGGRTAAHLAFRVVVVSSFQKFCIFAVSNGKIQIRLPINEVGVLSFQAVRQIEAVADENQSVHIRNLLTIKHIPTQKSCRFFTTLSLCPQFPVVRLLSGADIFGWSQYFRDPLGQRARRCRCTYRGSFWRSGDGRSGDKPLPALTHTCRQNALVAWRCHER